MGSVRDRRTVLVVESDPYERERLGTMLEEAGCDVLICSGPVGPDYTCVGGRGSRCPLADSADVVVLDTWLESETVGLGTSAGDLIALYRTSGLPIVTLGTERGSVDVFGEEPVIHLERRPDPTLAFFAAGEDLRVAPKPGA